MPVDVGAELVPEARFDVAEAIGPEPERKEKPKPLTRPTLRAWLESPRSGVYQISRRDVVVLRNQQDHKDGLDYQSLDSLLQIGEGEAVLEGLRGQMGNIIYCSGGNYFCVNVPSGAIEDVEAASGDPRANLLAALREAGFTNVRQLEPREHVGYAFNVASRNNVGNRKPAEKRPKEA